MVVKFILLLFFEKDFVCIISIEVVVNRVKNHQLSWCLSSLSQQRLTIKMQYGIATKMFLYVNTSYLNSKFDRKICDVNQV